MAKEGSQTSEGRGLHLEVTDFHALVLERLNLLVLIWVGNVGTELTALGTVETTAGNGIAFNHVFTGNLVDEVGIGYGYVWCALDGIPLHVLLEGFLHRDVADDVTSGIVVEQAVEADALDRGNETASRREGL